MTFIVETANAYTERRITKREFLRRMGLAGIGFSAFGLGMLGGHRRGDARGLSLAGGGLPDNQARWLKEVGGKFKGARIRYTTEATPPSIVLNQIKKEFTDPTGIEVEIAIVPLEQVLAEVTQDVQGQLGTNDLYYLDQSWIATFARDCVNPVELYKNRPDLAMPDFDWDDFSTPLVDGVAQVDGQWIGIPFDIPIFILMYRKDLLEKHGVTVLQGDHDPLHPRRRRRPDPQFDLCRPARQGEGEGRAWHDPASGRGEVDDRQRHRHRTTYDALGGPVDQRDPD